MHGESSHGASALILEHRDFAEALARKIHATLPAHVEVEDLIGFAVLGLAQAAALFDASRGAQFKTFAYARIRGAIFDGIAQTLGTSRHLHAEARKLRRQLALEESADEVCEQFGLAAQGGSTAEGLLSHLRGAIRDLGQVFLLNGGGEDPADDGAEQDPRERLELEELREELRAALGRLPNEEAELIRLHYFEGLTFTECARRLGKHKSWISRLHARSLERLRSCVSAMPVMA